MTPATQQPAINLVQQAVHAQFSSRPTLREVVTQRLGDSLTEKFPNGRLAPTELFLAVVRDGGGRDLHPLVQVALGHLADGRFPDLAPRGGLDCYVGDATGNRLSPAFDLGVVESVIRELPLILHIAYQDALAAYWGHDSDAGGSRWQWLARLLCGQMQAASARPPCTDPELTHLLDTLTRYPTREARGRQRSGEAAVHAYTVEALLVRDNTRLTVQSSDILVVNSTRVLLCRVDGRIESWPDLDAFGQAWGEQMQRRYLAERFTWNLYEPDGDIFEVQAALILNQQLDDLAALPLPAARSVGELEQRYASITSVACLFNDARTLPRNTFAAVRARLPDWLQQASPADRFAYRECLLEQANAGESYLEGVDDIHTYASRHLNHQLCLDRNAALHGQRTCPEATPARYKAEQLEATFHVPVGTLDSGYVEPVSMSLVCLALKNLSGKPKGRMMLRHTAGEPLEPWLTPEYVLQLVQRVDIGLNYPAYIRQELLGDSAQAKKRMELFTRQQPAQLKLQALESKIRGDAGPAPVQVPGCHEATTWAPASSRAGETRLSALGVRYVQAVLASPRSERFVENVEVVMRVLAFQRKPGANGDVVQNMFIIESRDLQSGPHIVYRPAYHPPLLEFANRALLLDAITLPGALQQSVLDWLPDNARAVYANGGFHEPHYVRIGGIGSEFDPLPPPPKPATLTAIDDESGLHIHQALNNGQLLPYLFTCQAKQLAEQATRESTSNTQSRWALMLEGMQLGFNTLLMLLRGPLATVGWFMQLATSLKQDLPALESDDPTARELAWVDLLLNTAMVLVHHSVPLTEIPVTDTPHAPHTPLPLRRPPGQAVQARTQVKRGTIGLPSEPPGSGRTLLDFDHSVASDSGSARLLEKLLQVNVRWPEPAVEPLASGRFKGLYALDNRWYASVGGLFFQVHIVPGVAEVFIVHPDKPDHPGIKLATDGNGHWTLDRGLKLLGGGPKRLAALRVENRRKTEALIERMQTLSAEITPLMETFTASLARMSSAYEGLNQQSRALKLVWALLEKASVEQRPALEARHQQQIRSFATERRHYEILLGTLRERFAHALPLRLELVDVGTGLEKYGGAGVHIQDRADVLGTLYDHQRLIHTYQIGWIETLQFTERGEPMSSVGKRMLIDKLFGDPTAYNQYMARSVELADAIQQLAEGTRAMESTLERLETDSVAGRVIREQKIASIVNPERFFPENLTLRALIPRAWASFELVQPVSPQEAFYVERLDMDDLSATLLSHIEVRSSTQYSLDEQRGVLETSLLKYQQYQQSLAALKLINPARLNPPSEHLLEGLHDAQALAERDLESVVRNQEQLEVHLPLSKTLRKQATSKRVFKTRKKHYLIGDLKPGTPQMPEEHFDITDSLTGETMTSFQNAPEGWRPIREPLPAEPKTAPLERSLMTLKVLGQTLISEGVSIEQLATTQQQLLESPLTRQTINPGDWDQLLSGQAEKLRALADEVVREHLAKPTAQDLIDDLRAHARDMTRTARHMTSAAYKRQWPTLQSLEYLWRHGEIDINLTSTADPQRPTLSGDFFTEYAIYDKAQKPPKVLWYAHFHYDRADAPPERYTRAHLKLAEQRKYTQKDLLKRQVQTSLQRQQAPDATPIEKILYVLITPPQDQLFLAIAPTRAKR
ncbi:dermonecrotic toxin domain-containing protein [Pseudomonas poae]|uniref:Dermonecrotic toxin N-terminal domain-containing protein n=1 Tax=Pseudomonas poae TaxID=200451 RepID=A0A2S9EBQ8_9PSED|nr:DUF6543 domain-containing protein [Pseudomonas poae]PRA25783.1 hypothetical protein CQZ97_22525 [Pseudomonas poae]PRC12347.1 hypothetical protein CQZ99_23260 [Pseudomonas poae]